MESELSIRRRRLRFRAWHRGTKEADYLIGGFVDSRLSSFTLSDIDWVEALLAEQDADIMAWIMGVTPCPPQYDGPLMQDMQRLDYVPDPGSYA